jgi:hypothetical protein
MNRENLDCVAGAPVVQSIDAALMRDFQAPVIQSVWQEMGRAIVLGIPGHYPWLPEDHDLQHNCDAMGCGQCHVLARLPLNGRAE